jgi:hypothetical protein
MESLGSDLKNYKSLFEEIAQNDSEIYLTKSFQDAIRYSDGNNNNGSSKSGDDEIRCCCCKVHRRQRQNTNQMATSFIAGGAVTNTKSFSVSNNIYNTIWISEMKNATDYIEYLNETRRNSFSSLNKDNRSNYYNLMKNESHSLSGYTDASTISVRDSINGRGKNFLQVPKLELPHEHMRRTPEFEDISKKIDQIHTLDANVSSLIYKSIEVHADILVRCEIFI